MVAKVDFLLNKINAPKQLKCRFSRTYSSSVVGDLNRVQVTLRCAVNGVNGINNYSNVQLSGPGNGRNSGCVRCKPQRVTSAGSGGRRDTLRPPTLLLRPGAAANAAGAGAAVANSVLCCSFCTPSTSFRWSKVTACRLTYMQTTRRYMDHAAVSKRWLIVGSRWYGPS